MLKIKHFTFILCLLISMSSVAQGFTAYTTDDRAGVNRVQINPAFALDSTSKFDINILSIDVTGSTDYLKDFNWNNSNNRIKLDNTLNMITNVQAPSFTYNIDSKNAFGMFIGAHVGLAATFDGNIATSFSDHNMNFNNANVNGGVFAWSEVGFTYARQIYAKGPHRFAVAASIKILGNVGFLGVNINNLTSTIDTSDMNNPVFNVHGSVSYSVPNDFAVDSQAIKIKYSPQIGLGADIGAVYSWTPDGDTDYKLKANFAIVDIGSIQQNNVNTRTYTVNVDFLKSEWENLTPSDIEKKLREKINSGVNFTNVKSDPKFKLPTRINLGVDYRINTQFHANLSATLPLVKDYMNGIGNNLKTSAVITPRYQKKWFSVQMPIGTNIYGDFMWGTGVSCGYFFIGTNDGFSALCRSSLSSANMYLGIKVPIDRKYKEASNRL